LEAKCDLAGVGDEFDYYESNYVICTRVTVRVRGIRVRVRFRVR